ncbi:MAG TPA: D-mannonate oxidoreductase [Marinilabiliales bacterium]|nr:MAG: D-mannonate oxidoreductase [Bacteroidetes bacterium GWC2_40_13]OFX72862.1 MAG: D-mannonate oxidoreductase [Bacteroidetes bacterium GWD2_40_43]OFX93555.1 MAG: D-mannonate oxidoreductase [Bacteroidetes bacterium GWE2_40_63]OFY18295.1 MAG: D-mannonate oxidoreductase [Bacteroidetes bacterium GWF2_40_13]OFZ27523.1 MAG: D-mannonate oxidoreductase [Bacteroidetes bacterium RIFOXYC2_FULL_40_12]HAM99891.1 D-mannonate oxidoreductase [Marinilabiliales bacterium]
MYMLSFNDLQGKVCVITGGAGVIGTAIAKDMVAVGVKVAILDRDEQKAIEVAGSLSAKSANGGIAKGYKADVLDKKQLEEAKQKINQELGSIALLINGAGGNSPKATTQLEKIEKENLNELEKTFYGLDIEGFDFVFDLNFKGTVLPTMVFSRDMLENGKGSILNISSMNSFKPLTKIPAYSAAKASINNFTQWLAVHLAKTGIRVNAIAPGFFLTNQNRFLMIDEKTGGPTPRGKKVIDNTPMNRYGEVEELSGTVLYLLSDVSKFVTGICIPVDGGFSAFGGV